MKPALTLLVLWACLLAASSSYAQPSTAFGTQATSKSYQFLQQHKDDPSAKDRPEAHQEGVTPEPYDRDLLPDSIRGSLCVPSLAAQEGKATSKLPQACAQ